MADIYMHARLAEELKKMLAVPLDEKLLFVGAQGPDPLYYKATGEEAKDYKFLADRIHDTDTQTFLISMTNYVKEHYSDSLFSHYVGFICHYALDVHIHPYVYFNVGIYNQADEKTHQYKGLHFKFERTIDACLIEKEQNMKANKFKIHQAYFQKTVLPDSVLNMFEYAVKETFNKEGAGQMYKQGSSLMTSNIRSYVYDPYGVKKQLLKIADKFMKTELSMPDLSFFNHIESYDYLNESKSTWHHPLTNEPSNLSVEELFNNAKAFAYDIIKTVLEYIKEGKEINLKTVFTNLSFNSGMDCNIKEKMKYFNNYRK